MYNPRPLEVRVTLQTNQFRQLYDTSNLVQGLLQLEYLSDEEILRNRGEVAQINELTKKGRKALKNKKIFFIGRSQERVKKKLHKRRIYGIIKE